jgi:hypothetical protein
MLITFLGVECLVYHEFIPQGKTKNHTIHRNILQHIQDTVPWKQPHK